MAGRRGERSIPDRASDQGKENRAFHVRGRHDGGSRARDERPSNVHLRRNSRGARPSRGKTRVSSRRRGVPVRRESTRVHVESLACGKCRNVRNKTLAAGSGRCCCAGPPLRSTMGTVGGSTPSCPEILEARDSERVPGARVSAVRRAHTVTHTQQGRPRPGSRDSHHRRFNHPTFLRPPFTPTFFFAPSMAKLRHQTLVPNREISQFSSFHQPVCFFSL